MAITIDPMNINAGDPVTAELIGTIVANLQKVAKGEVVSNISLQNTTESGAAASVSSTVWSSAAKKVTVPSGTPKPVTFSFGSTKWASPPKVWVQFYIQGLSTPSWAESQIFTQVVDISTTEASILFRSSTKSIINVVMFAVGTLA